MTERYQSEVINRQEFNTESHGLLTIECAADTLGAVTVGFGRSFTIRFSVTDAQNLVSMLEDAQEAALFMSNQRQALSLSGALM